MSLARIHSCVLNVHNHSRSFAATPSQPPEQRAAEIIDKLPSSPSLITKTGTAVLGTGLLAAAISQELYVVNEETIVLVATFLLFGYIGKVCSLAHLR
jgi:F-type H+-transporting ATPase subunit b